VIVDKILISLSLFALGSCNYPVSEEQKAIESAAKAAKSHPVYGGSMLDWEKPDVVDEGHAFRVKFSPAPGWMGGSVTYSVNKSNGELKIVAAEQ
jgi:hypothetical protein